MKTLKFQRLIGMGLGAGVAIAAVYGFTSFNSHQPPQLQADGFHDLTDYGTPSLLFNDISGAAATPSATQLPTPEITADTIVTIVPIAPPPTDSMTTGEPEIAIDETHGEDELFIEMVSDLGTVDDTGLVTPIETIDSETENDSETQWVANTDTDTVVSEDKQATNTEDLSADETVASAPAANATEPLVPSKPENAVVKNGESTAEVSHWKTNPFIAHVASQPHDSIHEQAAVPSIATVQNSGALTNPFYSNGATKTSILDSSTSGVASAPVAATEADTQWVEDIVPEPMKFGTDNPVAWESSTPEIPPSFTAPSSLDDRQSPQSVMATADRSEAHDSRDSNDPYAIAPLNMGLTESVAQQAVQHIEYGKTLARRGAAFAARQEFYSALRVIAQANDAKTGINEFSLSLRRGIMALKEAKDFIVNDTETEIGLDVALAAETHRSHVLTDEEAELLTPVEALQRYFTLAQNQLERAVGQNVVSAEALYCLGKLNTSASRSTPTANRINTAQAIVYHRAALTSDPNHFRSSSELGVLMARSGNLSEARDLIKKSLRIRPTPQSWNNLAKIHQRLEEPQLAQLAQMEFRRTLQMNPSGNIQWKPAMQFNAEAPMEFHEAVAAKPVTPAPAPPANQQSSDNEGKPKSLGKLIKGLF